MMTNIENNHLCQISLDDNQDSNFINRLSTILQKKLYLQDVREQLKIPSAKVVILPLKNPVILLVTERLEKIIPKAHHQVIQPIGRRLLTWFVTLAIAILTYQIVYKELKIDTILLLHRAN